MTEYGRRKIEEAKKNGQWDNAASPSAISEEQIAAVAALLKENAQAYTNFQKMPASVKKTYTRAYLDAKTEAGRSRRLAWMMDSHTGNSGFLPDRHSVRDFNAACEKKHRHLCHIYVQHRLYPDEGGTV